MCDTRLQAVGPTEGLRYREHLAAGRGCGPRLDRLLAELQKVEHRSKNRPGGYWIAEAVPEAAFHGLSRSMSINSTKAVLLLTDGASAGVADYEDPGDWVGALARILAGGPERFLSELHDLEQADIDGRRWPRAKPHDDKSIALLTPIRTRGSDPTDP